MKVEQIVVNTLVFEYELKNGTLQHELFARLQELGVQNVEVRREYIQKPEEFEWIASAAKDHELGIFYSVPDCLFSEGKMQSLKLKNYLGEAEKINAKMVKFTKGDFSGWKEEDLRHFKQMAEAYSGTVTVENDQTERDGKMEALLPFYLESEENGVPLKATFDIGNGCWVGDEALESARKVQSFTRFVHLKDVEMTEDGPKAAFLGEGILPWQDIMRAFADSAYAAIEYPCGEKPFEQLPKELAKLMNLS